MLAVSLAAASPLPTKTLRAYFLAELAGTLILESARHTVSFDSDTYRILYCLALLPVRLLAYMIAFKTSKWLSLVCIPFAGILLWIALRGVGEPTLDQWIIIADGVAVTVAGMALTFTAPFTLHRNVYGTLAILWMLLGLFDFGYVLQPYGKWQELNDSLLPVMVIGAFGWIGITGWSKRLQAAHR